MLLTAAIATDLYGRAKIGVVFGTMFTFMNLGFGAGSFLDGLAYDATGNYDISLLVNAALGAVAAIAVLRVKGRLMDETVVARLMTEPAGAVGQPAIARAD